MSNELRKMLVCSSLGWPSSQELDKAISELDKLIAERDAEFERLRAHAETMHAWIDSLLSAIECAEEDIGHRPIADIIAEGGPIFEAYKDAYKRPTTNTTKEEKTTMNNTQNTDEVICPLCCHHFGAIPLNIQTKLSEQAAEIESYKRLVQAASKLYFAGVWQLMQIVPSVDMKEQMQMWADLRDALNLEPGTATRLGIAPNNNKQQTEIDRLTAENVAQLAEIERLQRRLALLLPAINGAEHDMGYRPVDAIIIAAQEAEINHLWDELRIIATADPSKWEPEVRNQFQEWAQNRARSAISKGKETKL